MAEFDLARAEGIITIAYAGALLPLVLAWRGSPPSRERLFFAGAALLILLLGLNKPLDLQTSLTDLGRRMARAEGWFEHRRQVQQAFIAALALSTAATASVVGWWARRLGPAVWLTLLGLLGLSGFVLLRAISFHHVDSLLRLPLLGTRAWVTLELAGIALVAAGALMALARRR